MAKKNSLKIANENLSVVISQSDKDWIKEKFGYPLSGDKLWKYRRTCRKRNLIFIAEMKAKALL